MDAVDLYEDARGRQEHLVLANMAMVKRVALHLKGRIPPLLDVDELVQVGMLGLIEAARVFDPRRGIPFEFYATTRVRGAMLDELRRVSDMTRSAVTFQRSESAAEHRLVAELGRQPTEAEVAQSMGKDLAEYQREQGAAIRTEMVSMEEVADEVMGLAGDALLQPEAAAERAQLLRALAGLIAQMPERDQLVVSLYYIEELNLKEIGEVIGVTESRVSQLLSGIVKRLRAALRPAPAVQGVAG